MIAVVAAAALFLTLTDAFGLDVLRFGPRLLYWLVLLGIGQTGNVLVRCALDSMQMSEERLFLAGILSCILVAVPVTVVVWLVTSFALSLPLEVARLPFFYLAVLVVTAPMLAINLLAQRRPLETHAEDARRTPEGAVQPAAIFSRMPMKLRGAKLYAVQAEDHYVRLFTSAGPDLVLLRFSDALAELRGIEGAQVHRSWWVARDAAQSSMREEGKLFLVLRDGTKAPVSRTFTRALQANGWL
jgi:DNA-binding LytR/AlgR family response regulator